MKNLDNTTEDSQMTLLEHREKKVLYKKQTNL